MYFSIYKLCDIKTEGFPFSATHHLINNIIINLYRGRVRRKERGGGRGERERRDRERQTDRETDRERDRERALYVLLSLTVVCVYFHFIVGDKLSHSLSHLVPDFLFLASNFVTFCTLGTRV